MSVLIGRLIERDKPYPSCGTVVFKIEQGKGPHAYHLRCSGCDRGGFWIGKQEAAALESKAAEAIS